MDQDTKIVKLPEPKHLNRHHWTNEEKIFKRKDKTFTELQNFNIPLRKAMLYKLSKSLFGPFLKELNKSETQCYALNDNKMQILNWDLKRYTIHDINIINDRNKIIKELYILLQKAVNDCDVIDLNFLENNLNNLSLNCCFIKTMDTCLQNFNNLQTLSLGGNYITDIPGSLLPRNLKLLELFDNLIFDVRSLSKNAPETIIQLGLRRNRLTNDSHIFSLLKCKNFPHLISLDLSDNDICDLTSLLNSFEEPTFLKALSLEGNPCAVIPEYKHEILKGFSDLQYLDFTLMLPQDRSYISTEKMKKFPQIIFYCHRILGLPEPPKDAKNLQVFYIEVNFPLLIENETTLEEEPVDQTETENKEQQTETDAKDKNKKDKEKNKKEKTAKKGKEPKMGKKKSYYSGENEYDEKFEQRNMWFKTERVTWSKIMEFPPVYINTPENNLKLIRDSFRSIVPVRIVYLKIAPFSAKLKKQKDKEKLKRDKKGKKTVKEESNISNTEPDDTIDEQQSEIILKKVTLASFYCNLKSVNWSDETVDYYWADHADIGKEALRINGSLKIMGGETLKKQAQQLVLNLCEYFELEKNNGGLIENVLSVQEAIEYDINADPKKPKVKQKIENVEEEFKKPLLPQVLTCQVGFGLSRY